MALTTVKASTVAPLTLFNLDGLEYARSVYIVDYKDIQQTAEVIDTSLVQVGIKDKHTDKHLIFPRPFNLWSNDGTTPYASLDALLADLAVFLGFNRVAGGSVTEGNDAEVIYLKGREDLDGSLRAIPDKNDAENWEFQLRTSGVWNDTGLQLAAATIHLGRELLVSAAGSYLFTRDLGESLKSLVPHIEFATGTGTAPYAHMPILGPLITNVDIQPDDTSESTKTNHNYVWAGAGNEFTFRMHIEVGTIAASSDITLTLYRGNDNTGLIFFQQNYPASDFPSLTRVSKTLGSLPETFAGQNIFIEYKSSTAFDLKGDSLGNMYVAHCYHEVTEEDITTSTTGMDRVITDAADGHILSDQHGNLILSGTSPQ